MQPYVWVLLQALILVPSLAALGLWQLERYEIRSVQQQQWRQQSPIQPFDRERAQRFSTVSLQGRLDPQRYLLLDNRVRDGRVGYEVVALLQLKDNATMLVNLGWLPADPDRSILPEIKLSAVSRQWVGRLDQPVIGFSLQPDQAFNGWPWRIQQLDMEPVSRVLGQPPLPWLLRLQTELFSGESMRWQPVTLPAKRHLGYAVQWFALALVWAGLSLWLLRVLRRDSTEAIT